MDDRTIIDLYWKRDEQAISETQRAYGGYCFTVANSILGNTWDSEEVVSDTWVHAWNTYMQLPMEPQEADFAAVDAEVQQDLKEMVIMYCPSYLRLASGANNEDYVVFEDHIIVSSYSTGILTRVLSDAYESGKSK